MEGNLDRPSDPVSRHGIVAESVLTVASWVAAFMRRPSMAHGKMAANEKPPGSQEGAGRNQTGTDPWRDMPIFPSREDQAGLPWIFRIPTFAIFFSVLIAMLQLLLWHVAAPAQFSLGESEYFGFVSQAALEVSILVLTLTPAMAALLLSVTSRTQRGLAVLSARSRFYQGIWGLFSPMLPAAATLLLVLLFVPIQTSVSITWVTGMLATVLSGSISLQVVTVLWSATSVRSQMAGEAEDSAEEIMRAVREGKIQILPKNGPDPPSG